MLSFNENATLYKLIDVSKSTAAGTRFIEYIGLSIINQMYSITTAATAHERTTDALAMSESKRFCSSVGPTDPMVTAPSHRNVDAQACLLFHWLVATIDEYCQALAAYRQSPSTKEQAASRPFNVDARMLQSPDAGSNPRTLRPQSPPPPM